MLHVVEDASRFVYGEATPLLVPADWQAEVERAGADQLRAFISDSDRRELGARAVQKVSNNTAKVIVEYATEAAIDVIVIGATGRGMVDRMLTGSVADKVIRRAPCPVLTVRTPEREFLRPDALQFVA